MPDFDISTHLRELHRLAGALTKMPVSYNMERERQWFDLLRMMNEGSSEFSASFLQQFSDDLRAVVHYLNGEISVGNRNPGALKFSNLIGNPYGFEEDLGMARVKSRPRASATQTIRTRNAEGGMRNGETVTERIVPSTGCEDATQPARVPLSKAIEEMRKAVEAAPSSIPHSAFRTPHS